jgi:hypothetical protein
MAMYNSHPNIKQEAFKIMSLTWFIWAMNNTSTAYGSPDWLDLKKKIIF